MFGIGFSIQHVKGGRRVAKFKARRLSAGRELSTRSARSGPPLARAGLVYTGTRHSTAGEVSPPSRHHHARRQGPQLPERRRPDARPRAEEEHDSELDAASARWPKSVIFGEAGAPSPLAARVGAASVDERRAPRDLHTELRATATALLPMRPGRGGRCAKGLLLGRRRARAVDSGCGPRPSLRVLPSTQTAPAGASTARPDFPRGTFS